MSRINIGMHNTANNEQKALVDAVQPGRVSNLLRKVVNAPVATVARLRLSSGEKISAVVVALAVGGWLPRHLHR
jgi:hypothetical protein